MSTVCVLLLVVFLTRAGALPTSGTTRVSDGSSGDGITAEMRRYKTELIKSRILNEVKLHTIPTVAAPVELPPHLVNLLLLNKEVEDNFLGEGEKMIAYPINDNISCSNYTFCSRFEFELITESKTISSVHFWVLKKDLAGVNVSVCSTVLLSSGDRHCKTRTPLYEVPSEVGSGIFAIPATVFTSEKTSPVIIDIEVNGVAVEEYEEQKPYLVANLSPFTTEKKKRSTNNDSNKDCTCCATDFHVSFKEIGWYWVVAPPTFNAKICYGKCNSQINSYPSHYHRLLSTALNNKTSTTDKKEGSWTPCCSPTKLKALNMIYVAGNNTNTNSTSSFIYHKIQDMITDDCGCW